MYEEKDSVKYLENIEFLYLELQEKLEIKAMANRTLNLNISHSSTVLSTKNNL